MTDIPEVGTPIQETPTIEAPVVETPAVETVEEDTLLGKEEGSDESSPKEGDESKEKPASGEVPEKYEVTMPEGFELDQGTLDLFSPVFKELGITNEGAQKLVEAYVPMIQDVAEKQRQDNLNQYKELVDGWKDETMKELGADADKKLSLSAKAINKFGGEELRTALNETGMGNHIEVVKFMIKVGETLSEDSVDEPAPQGLYGQEATNLDKMYPTMKQ